MQEIKSEDTPDTGTCLSARTGHGWVEACYKKGARRQLNETRDKNEVLCAK